METTSTRAKQNKAIAPRGMYEVATGLTAVRSGPGTAYESIGVLKGGHRFYGTPFMIGKKTWVKLDMEGLAPPVFSPSNHRGRTVGEGPHRMYNMSVAPMYYANPSSTIHDGVEDEEAWVRAEESCIARVRLARGEVHRPPGEVWKSDLARARTGRRSKFRKSFPAAALGGETSDAQSEVRSPMSSQVGSQADGDMPPDTMSRDLRRPSLSQPSSSQGSSLGPEGDYQARSLGSPADPAPKLLSKTQSAPNIHPDSWAGAGSGCWVNFRSYGVLGAGPNLNCGRFRQLAEPGGF